MRHLFIVIVLASMVGSGGSIVVADAPKGCKSQNTGSVSFQNRTSKTTHDVYWDGAQVATLAPGQTSPPVTAAAGVAHELKFFVTNSQTLACGLVTPIPIKCGDEIYYCAYP